MRTGSVLTCLLIIHPRRKGLHSVTTARCQVAANAAEAPGIAEELAVGRLTSDTVDLDALTCARAVARKGSGEIPAIERLPLVSVK